MSQEEHSDAGPGAAKAEASATATLHNVVSIVAAYVGHNSLRAADLPDFIAAVHASIRQLSDRPALAAEAAAITPAVPIKKSVTHDHIVCLEDGKQFKSLRRHLTSFHNLTPDAYRAKWGLPSDYPMVAPAYSETRSQLAKDAGLGQVAKPAAPHASASAESTPEEAPKVDAPKAARGRSKRSS